MFFLLLLQALPAFAGPTLTAQTLMRGSRVPLERAFPFNDKISPCEDLYQYTCSLELERFKLPKEKAGWSFAFTDGEERILQARKNFLANLRHFDPPTPRGKALRNYFLACMDPKASVVDERRFVQERLEKIAGLETREDFVEYITSILDQPVYSLLTFWTYPSQSDPNLSTVDLEASGVTFPEKTYYDKPENIKALTELLTVFFREIKLADPELRAKRVVAFEQGYAKVDIMPYEMRTRLSSPSSITRADLTKRFPNLHFEKILSRIPATTNLSVLGSETLGFIDRALKTEDLETLKDVYRFHQLRPYMDDAYQTYFNAQWDFNHKFLGGPEVRRDRTGRCTEAIQDRFGKELDAEILPILFKDFPEEKVKVLVEKVRSSFISQLEKNSWLSPSAKAEALRKIREAKLYLVKPASEEEWDFNPLVSYDPKAPIGNRLALGKARIEKVLAELQGPRNRVAWLSAPLSLNAYYVPMDNKFVLLQGILQSPFFKANQTNHENLGAIGAVVGHELGHAIDDRGSKYDSAGKLSQWMKAADLKAFSERGDRFVKQFDEIGHNGKLTLGENIGDHMGLRSAYEAAFPAGEGSSVDKRRFFIAYSRLWCTKVLPALEERLLKTDPHAMGYARVNQQVVHIAGFHEAFSCKPGDKLYVKPEDRLSVW